MISLTCCAALMALKEFFKNVDFNIKPKGGIDFQLKFCKKAPSLVFLSLFMKATSAPFSREFHSGRLYNDEQCREEGKKRSENTVCLLL